MRILFLHGWQSTPGGVKPTYLKEHGHEVLDPALPDDDFDAAVRIAQAEFDQHHPDVVVGHEHLLADPESLAKMAQARERYLKWKHERTDDNGKITRPVEHPPGKETNFRNHLDQS